MLHQRRVWFLLVSTKSQRHSAFPHSRKRCICSEVISSAVLKLSSQNGKSGRRLDCGNVQRSLFPSQSSCWFCLTAAKHCWSSFIADCEGLFPSTAAYRTSAAASRNSRTAATTLSALPGGTVLSSLRDSAVPINP